MSIRTYWPPLGGVNKNLLAPPKNYYVTPHYSSTALLLVTLSYSDTVNLGKLLSQPDDGVQAHLVHKEGGGEVSKHRWLHGPAGIPCGEMLGPDKCSGDDKGQVVIATP